MPTVTVSLADGPNVSATIAAGQDVNGSVISPGIITGQVYAVGSGAAGAAATIAVGTVTTVNPGDPATVVNSGTANAAVFDFEIPEGDPGANGSNGTDGTNFTGFFSGVPTGGADGDWAINQDNGDVYKRISGVWTIQSAITVPAAQARDSVLVMGTGGPTAIAFDVTDISTASYLTHNSGVNPSRFTALKAGRYSFDFRTAITSSTANQVMRFEFRVNGSTLSPVYQEVSTGTATNGRGTCALSWVTDLNANDYVEVVWTRVNGSTNATAIDQTIMIARKIGGLSELSATAGYGGVTNFTINANFTNGSGSQAVGYRTGLGGHVVLSGRCTSIAGAGLQITSGSGAGLIPSPAAEVKTVGWYKPASGNPQACGLVISTIGNITIEMPNGATLAAGDIIYLDGANYFT